MEEFKKLLSIADRLLGPEGCSWDKKQTFFTLQPYLLEETHELIEAIDLEDPEKILEELGDVLYALIFISKLGEIQNHFTLSESIQKVSDKLIRRHPHVFSDKRTDKIEEIERMWEEVKKKEGKKSPIEGIPPTLPALSRAQKVIGKLKKQKNSLIEEKIEDDLAQKFFDLVLEAEKDGIDAESALRKRVMEYEKRFREKKAGE